MEKEIKERNGCISFWLWLAIIANIAMTLFYAVSMFNINSGEMALGFGLCSIFGVVNVLSAILLLRWNKIGFYMIVVSSILAIVVNICVLKMDPVAMVGSLFAIVIWWAILQMKKDGVSAWSQLQSGWDGKHCRHLYQLFAAIGVVLFILTLIAFGNTGSNSNDDSEYEEVEVVEVADDETMTDEEVAEVVIVEEESVAEKNMRFLKSMIEQTNREYPQKLEEGITMKRIFIEGDYVVYQAEVDEDVIDMDLLEMNKKNMKAAIKENLNTSDPEIRMFKSTCTKAEKGIAYKYVGDTSGQSVYIRFSCNELKNM